MRHVTHPSDPFHIGPVKDTGAPGRIMGLLEKPVSHVLGMQKLRERYQEIQMQDNPELFARESLRVLDIQCQIDSQQLLHIPPHGPLVIVANHPFGALEGIILLRSIRCIRPDIKIMVNYLLSRIRELADATISVDPFGSSSSQQNSLAGLRRSIQWVEGGGALIVFPAGTVSHLHLRQRRVTDPRWHSSIARLIQRTAAPVVPIYFSGKNSAWFQVAGLLHPTFRTLMLPRQLLNKRGKTIRFDIGRAIAPEKLRKFPEPADLSAYIRFRTYLSGHRPAKTTPAPTTRTAPVIAAGAVEFLRSDISGLGPDRLLLAHNQYQVFCSTADRIPHLLNEIGRLREISFRSVGEGTGNNIDLDEFDRHYLHLFVWDRVESELVGAYRLCPIQETLERFGNDGLYLNRLFKFRRNYFQQLKPCLEMGRSFVQPAYQRQPASLMLLWKGIAAFLVKNPAYRMLIGPTSISNDYSVLSQQLILRFLQACKWDTERAAGIRPRHPVILGDLGDLDPGSALKNIDSIDEVSDWTAEIEPDRRGVPILLKQYLRLGARILAVNRDPSFNNSIDVLTIVDFATAERKSVSRYFPAGTADQYLNDPGPDNS